DQITVMARRFQRQIAERAHEIFPQRLDEPSAIVTLQRDLGIMDRDRIPREREPAVDHFLGGGHRRNVGARNARIQTKCHSERSEESAETNSRQTPNRSLRFFASLRMTMFSMRASRRRLRLAAERRVVVEVEQFE